LAEQLWLIRLRRTGKHVPPGLRRFEEGNNPAAWRCEEDELAGGALLLLLLLLTWLLPVLVDMLWLLPPPPALLSSLEAPPVEPSKRGQPDTFFLLPLWGNLANSSTFSRLVAFTLHTSDAWSMLPAPPPPPPPP
jgi:hypothetical protein